MLVQLNATEVKLVQAFTEKSRLESDLDRDRHRIQNNEVRIFELQELLKKSDAEVDQLKRQVNGEYNQVGN